MPFRIGKFKFTRQAPPPSLKGYGRASFTLIELLVVIAIVAVLSVVVVLTLNPAELLKQARDSTRLSDLAIINKSIGLYQADRPDSSLGVASTTYISIPDPTATTTLGTNCAGIGLSTSSLPSGWSYHCAASSTVKNTDGTGWIPVNFSQISSGPPLERLPLDPLNTSSTGNYYAYTMGGSWELTTALEAQKHKLGGASDKISTDGGDAMGLYETGSNKTLTPIDYGDPSLMGWWTFEEGTGNPSDRSGHGIASNFNGAGTHYSTSAKTGSYAGQFNVGGVASDILYLTNIPSISPPYSISVWFNPSEAAALATMVLGGTSYPKYMAMNWTSGVLKSFHYGSGGGYRLSTKQWSGSDLGTWWHLVFVTPSTDPSTYKIYLNGADDSGTVGGSSAGALPTAAGYINTKGLIDDVRIYNRALSLGEIQAIYNATR